MLWLDPSHVLTVLLGPGVKPRTGEQTWVGLTRAYRGMLDARSGRNPTAIVSSSPPDRAQLDEAPPTQLVRVDARSGRVTHITELPPVVDNAPHLIVVSPTRDLAAVLWARRPGVADSARGWDMHHIATDLGFVALNRVDTSVRWSPDVRPYSVSDGPELVPASWSSTDSSFAVVDYAGYRSGAAGEEMGAAAAVGDPVIAAIDPRMMTVRRIRPGQLPTTRNDTARVGETARFLAPRRMRWRPNDRLLVETSRGVGFEWLSVKSDGETTVATANDTADALASSQTTPRFYKDRIGRLLEDEPDGTPTVVFPAINPALAHVAQTQYVTYHYRSALGDSLTATLLLPYHYVPGHRYAVVVYGYPGNTDNGQRSVIENLRFLNVSVLAGHGYVVLLPSMPFDAPAADSNPMEHLNDGVEPAIRRAVALGYADSSRIGIIGQSAGAYGVYGLLTQVHLFKAAVASNGVSDFISLYGMMGTAKQYTAPNIAAMAGPSYLESGDAGRMKGPPWQVPTRYVRNSPLFFADRITTPLLMIHGDIDGLGEQQEELFVALYRLRRRAVLVRYLGEAHVLESPLNVLDYWRRVFAWFDEYLTAGTRQSEGGNPSRR
jgi:hypothetical protein